MNKYKVYISHSIRGVKGADATDEDMRKNNEKAIEFVNNLKALFPEVDFYCPGEHDEFVLHAYRRGILSEDEILMIDCDIILKRDMVLAWEPDRHTSNGMMVELVYGSMAGKEIAVAETFVQARDIIHTALNRRIK